jgi:hypothetical protein
LYTGRINAEPNSYSTNLVYVFESLLVILLTPKSRIVGLLSDLVVRGLLEKYPTFGREKETGLLGALDT